jgi:hypothetical protein
MALPVTLLLAVIGVAMLWVTAYFGRAILSPPLILEVTALGILSYLDLGSHRYVGKSRLIPWDKIVHIDYYRARNAITPEGPSGQLRVDTARIQLKPGHALPIGDLSVLRRLGFPGIDGRDSTGIDWDNTIFLPASTSFGTPQSFAQELEHLRAKSVNPR